MSYRTSYLDYSSLSYHHSNLGLLSFLIKKLRTFLTILYYHQILIQNQILINDLFLLH